MLFPGVAAAFLKMVMAVSCPHERPGGCMADTLLPFGVAAMHCPIQSHRMVLNEAIAEGLASVVPLGHNMSPQGKLRSSGVKLVLAS